MNEKPVTVIYDTMIGKKSGDGSGMLQDDEAPAVTRSPGTASIKRTFMIKVNRVVRAFVPSLSPSTRFILWKLCLMFAVDSFASGLIAL